MRLHTNLILITISFLVMSMTNLAAQSSKSCGHDHTQRELFDTQEEYEKAKSDVIKGAYSKYLAQANQKSNSVLAVPIVFHVIHDGEALGVGSNIPDGRVQAQLDVLNGDFSASNPNFSDATRPAWDAVKGNPLISFCLATIDPNGAATSGIVRHDIEITGADANDNNIEEVKAMVAWDSDEYMNVFVLSIPGTDASGGVVGYAYLPYFGTVGQDLDGVVVDYNWFGGDGYPQSGDKTLTHEVGHYLGLLHTFDGSSCTKDDGMTDTPNVSDYTASTMPSLSCGNAMNPYPSGPESCGNENMYINYMDYVNDENCVTSFTIEQIAVMRGVLQGTASGYATRLPLITNAATACNGSEVCDLAATMTHTDPSCTGSSDGTATVTASAGTAPYTYAWSTTPSQSLLTATGLAPGTYYVTTTDNDGCTIVNSAVIEEASGTVNFGLSETHSDVSCNRGNDAQINVSVATSGPFTYAWSSGQTTQDITGIAAGSYTLTVTNAAGCSQEIQVIITEPTAIEVTSVTTDVNCYEGNDGAIDVSVIGGAGSYTYAWTGGAITQDVSGLSAGSYSLTVTDANGCSKVHNQVITEAPEQLLNINTTDITTDGGSDGTATASASGGVAPYTFAWSNAGSTPTINNLTPGTYSVTVTDANNCTIIGSDVVGDFANPCDGNRPNAPGQSVDITLCPGQSFTVGTGAGIDWYDAPSGGTLLISNPTYTPSVSGTYYVEARNINTGCVSLNRTAIGITISEVDFNILGDDLSCAGDVTELSINHTAGSGSYSYVWSTGEFSATISVSLGGTYGATVTDNFGCFTTSSIVIADAPEAIGVSFSTFAESVNNGNDGRIESVIVGGTPGYTYLWSNGATTADLNNLAPGSYTLTVTDANGCSQVGTTIVDGFSCDALQVSLTTVDVSCFGGTDGSISATASGVAPFTYNWGNGMPTTKDITGLSAGTYNLTAVDNNGCTGTSSVVINEPIVLNVSLDKVNESAGNADDGAINTTVTGGVPGYAYTWSDGSSDANRSGLAPGTYTVVVRDANLCESSVTAVIEEYACPAIQIAPIVRHTGCAGDGLGAIKLNVLQIVAPYTVNWSTGSTADDISGLVMDNYSVTLTGADGCELLRTFTIGERPPLTASISSTDETRNDTNDGTATVTVSGGTQPFVYAWSNGATSAETGNLEPGTYTVMVTDGNGCTFEDTVQVSAYVCPSFDLVNINKTDNICGGDANGVLGATISGGTAPYEFNWSNGGSTSVIDGLVAGQYSLEVTDAMNCKVSGSEDLVDPQTLLVTPTITHVSGIGLSDGSASITIQGGTGNITILWSTGSTGPTIDNLVKGTYNYTVTDSNGCEVNGAVIIEEYICPDLTLDIEITDIACVGETNGELKAIPGNGTAPYTFVWSNAATTETATGLGIGSYSVTVTDTKGCNVTGTADIVEPTQLSYTNTQGEVTGYSTNDGIVDIVISGGVAPYEVAWTDGGSGALRADLAPGNFGFVILDANRCSVSGTVDIDEFDCPVITMTTSIFNNACEDGDIGGIDAVVTGGLEPYVYTVDGVAYDSASIRGLSAGSYELVVTDANGCPVSATFEVETPMAMTVTDVMTTDATGILPGAASVFVIGGTEPYSYLWPDGRTDAINNALFAGIHDLIITDSIGCELIEQVIVHQTDDLNAIEDLELFEAHPNPASDMVTVQVEFAVVKDIRVVITNATGMPVYDEVLSTEVYNRDIDLSGFTRGLYSINIYTADEVITQPLAIF